MGRKAPGYWDRRRPRYLLSRLLELRMLRGGFANVNTERVGCSAARAKGACANRRTMRREELAAPVFQSLQNRLMDDNLCDLFCREYAEHMNRLHRERNANRASVKSMLAKVERELDRLVQALVEGVPASRVKARMSEFEARKVELEAQVQEPEGSVVAIHPNMGRYYREQVSQLRAALTEEN